MISSLCNNINHSHMEINPLKMACSLARLPMWWDLFLKENGAGWWWVGGSTHTVFSHPTECNCQRTMYRVFRQGMLHQEPPSCCYSHSRYKILKTTHVYIFLSVATETTKSSSPLYGSYHYKAKEPQSTLWVPKYNSVALSLIKMCETTIT